MFFSVYCVFAVWLPVTRTAILVTFYLNAPLYLPTCLPVSSCLIVLVPIYFYSCVLRMIRREIIDPVRKRAEIGLLVLSIMGIGYDTVHMWLYCSIMPNSDIADNNAIMASLTLDIIGLIGQIITYFFLAGYTSKLVCCSQNGYSTFE